MTKHLKYLKYVLRHKWFVFIACRQCKVGLWQSLIHDWHKFLPSEWIAYAENFYGSHFKWSETHGDARNFLSYKDSKEWWSSRFDFAWNAHQKRGKHHWQYWILINDSSEPKQQALQMPRKYYTEMVADWWGAGRAITGHWDAFTWYQKNRHNIILHPETRVAVEAMLEDGRLSFSTPENIAKRVRILGC